MWFCWLIYLCKIDVPIIGKTDNKAHAFQTFWEATQQKYIPKQGGQSWNIFWVVCGHHYSRVYVPVRVIWGLIHLLAIYVHVQIGPNHPLPRPTGRQVRWNIYQNRDVIPWIHSVLHVATTKVSALACGTLMIDLFAGCSCPPHYWNPGYKATTTTACPVAYKIWGTAIKMTCSLCQNMIWAYVLALVSTETIY